MPDNEQFWKELMGEDYDPSVFAEDGAVSAELDKALGHAGTDWDAPKGEFKVEYVDKDGAPITGKPASEKISVEKAAPEPQPSGIAKAEEDAERFRQAFAPKSENTKPKEPVPAEKKTAPLGKQTKKTDIRELPEEMVGPADFEVDFDYDDEYQDVEEKIVKRGRGKRTGCLGGILYFIFVIAVSLVLAMFGWQAATDVLGLNGGSADVEITLPKSIFSQVEREKEDENGEPVMQTVTVADMDYVADILYENDLIEYKWLFKLFSKFATGDEKVAAGTYVVSQDYDYRALINGMTARGGVKVEVDITIPEGYNVTQIVKLLVDQKVCEEAELWDILANYEFEYDFLSAETLGDKYRLEGYLFPDTYTFYIGDTPSRVINKMLKNFSNKWTEEFDLLAEELGYTMEEILTVASMIEKEAGVDSERATIASVIYNRLETNKTNGLLQIDATIVYAMARDGVEGGIDTEYDSPYNTYTNQGLTPGPISNPGIASIKAALEPEDTKYYWYALGQDNAHQFFKNYDSFTAFVNSDEYGG